MRTTFTTEETLKLKENPCVFDCTSNMVNYTFEFKKRALELHSEGVFAKEIWRRSGFDVSKWRKDYCRSTLSDWKKIVKTHGIDGLNRNGGIRFDRGPTKTEADTIKRLTLQVQYLKAENDFLAKLRAKRAELNSGPAKNFESSEH